jgi:hypothetical protein
MSKPCYRLRTYDQTPPGGYPFAQRTPYREFPSQPQIETQAHLVADWRKANGLARATIAEALADIDRYTCFRLGNMDTWCAACDATSINAVALSAASPIISPCKGCGAPVQV